MNCTYGCRYCIQLMYTALCDYDCLCVLSVLLFLYFYEVLRDFDLSQKHRGLIWRCPEAFWAQTLNTGFAWSSDRSRDQAQKGKTKQTSFQYISIPKSKSVISMHMFVMFFQRFCVLFPFHRKCRKSFNNRNR